MNINKLETFCHLSFWTLATLLLTAFIIVGCSAPRQVTQLVRDVKVDTVYLSNTQYDSVYIYQDRLIDHRLGTLEPSGTLKPDTLYIRDVSVEYRYKLLRDTVKVIHRDSIPYEVTVTEVKEITRPLTWFDHLTRFSFWFLVGAFTTYLFIKIKRVFKY